MYQAESRRSGLGVNGSAMIVRGAFELLRFELLCCDSRWFRSVPGVVRHSEGVILYVKGINMGLIERRFRTGRVDVDETPRQV